MAEFANANPVSLTRFLLKEQTKHKEATGEFTFLMSSIQLACKAISMAVRKAGIAGLYGLDGTVNVQGEDVKKLDVLSNEHFVNAIKSSTTASVLVSEEVEDAIFIEDQRMRGPYCVCFDPLDGSSNIDCNISVGSIFSIYKIPNFSAERKPTVKDVLLPGTKLAAAGYCMYGSATQMVLTFGQGVHVFTHDPALGEFLLTQQNVLIPTSPKKIYSCNEGNLAFYSDNLQRFVDKVKATGNYSLRYVGSMVADVHRTILYGGIFLYPADSRSPNGKLRLLYEGNPMSFIMEQAGGVALTDIEMKESGKFKRVLEVQPEEIHQRLGVIMGCKRDIDLVLKEYE